MASNLRVDTILPSTGTTLGIGTASGTINFLGNSNIVTSGTLTAASASITGNLGVGGTLTYEDVTNIDSVGVVTARTNINLGDSIIHIGDTNTKIRFPAADTITAETGGAERFRINSQGKVLVNTTTASSVGNSQYSRLEVSGNSSASNGPGHLSLKRGTASASLSNGDTLSRLIFSSLDGGDFAYIQASVDGSASASYFPASMRFHTCADGANTATERLRINSNGSVEMKGGSAAHYVLTNSGKAANHIHIDGQAGNSGEMGGAISFDCGGTGCAAIAGLQQSSDSDKIGLAFIVHQSSNGADNAIEAARFDNDGNFIIGTTGAIQSSVLSVKSGNNQRIAVLESDGTGANDAILFRNDNGDVGYIRTSGSSTTYGTSSDYRLKENVVSISDGITRLKTLKPSRFNFKVDTDTTVDGFLAHEVTAVPEAITGTKDEVDSDNNPVYQGIDQSKLVPLLTAALQEAVARIEALERGS